MLDYARKLARVPKELLGLEKLAINKTQDIQGFREAIAVGFEIDVIGHLSPAVVDVNRRIREDGLRPTIEAWQAASSRAGRRLPTVPSFRRGAERRVHSIEAACGPQERANELCVSGNCNHLA